MVDNLERGVWLRRIAVLALVLLIIGALTLIALLRFDDNPIEGRWQLILIELPRGSLQRGDGAWIEFDGDDFSGHVDCVDFEGVATLLPDQHIELAQIAWSITCEPVTALADAHMSHLDTLSRYSGRNSLTIQTTDASVQFTYAKP